MWVTKRSGEREEYDEGKVRRAVLRSGAGEAEAEEILEKVRQVLYDGIPTEQIYRLVGRLLDRRRAIRYGLKGSILLLGPEGHHFELLVARLFQSMGYSVKTNEKVMGRCVPHEVDILLEKGGKRLMVECKFHNSPGAKCAIQTALYTYARFLDLSESVSFSAPWLVTNTRFSSEVVSYAECTGMKLLGWKHPEGSGLERLIDKNRLYPVTAMGLKKAHEKMLLDKKIITVRDVVDSKDCLFELLPEASASEALEIARDLLG